MKNSWSRKVSWFSLIFVLSFLFVAVLPVQAAEIPDDGTVDEDTVIDDDLLISDEEVEINGRVNGNVIATAGRIEVNGIIEGDLFAFAQTVVIGKDAVIGGNLFAGAAEVMVEGMVGGSVFGGAANFIFDDGAVSQGNLYVGGYSLEIAEEAKIDRSVYFGGYQIDFSGAVADDLKVSAEAVEVSGVVGKNMVVEISDPESHDAMPYTSFSFPGLENPPRALKGGLNIEDSAQIAGDLTVIAAMMMVPEFENVPDGRVILQTPVPSAEDEADVNGGVDNQREDGGVRIVWRWLRRNAARFIALCMLGALLMWLCRKPFEETVQKMVIQPWTSLGYGALGVFTGYLAAFIIFLVIVIAALLIGLLSFGTLGTVVGGLGFSALTIVYTAFNVSVHYISKLVVAFWLGRVILQPKEDETVGRGWLALLIGVALYAVVRALPVLGWFIALVVTFFGLGAIILWCVDWWKSYRANHPSKIEEELLSKTDETPKTNMEFTLPESS
ncbi:MAG: polymer-forming cytoskeletal protein [Anaerolineaceae bacterium]|nr:polymer-forming cytoskeletal protein [Anaerolineaceae bacterium]